MEASKKSKANSPYYFKNEHGRIILASWDGDCRTNHYSFHFPVKKNPSHLFDQLNYLSFDYSFYDYEQEAVNGYENYGDTYDD